jgi:glycosyltransferase involved in cell wall biosynthesis
MSTPLVSICIPAYKKPQFVIRCLESIRKQDYKLVEVIISDDSPDEDIKQAIVPFKNDLQILYYHNRPALGSPRNWNAAIDKATGIYVILMHQDDWFHSKDAISIFVKAIESFDVDFVFCQNTAIDEEGKIIKLQAIPSLLKEMAVKPDHLVRAQVIGPPSNTMFKRDIPIRYDERFIWLVDVDYYSRLLKSGFKYHYIEMHLVSIGLHEDQTTVFCRTHADIIFKENIWFANKIDKKTFSDVLIFDYYWRLLRNYKIRSVEDIKANKVLFDEIPTVILYMLAHQIKYPSFLLRIGLISKVAMTFCFLTWNLKSKKQ